MLTAAKARIIGLGSYLPEKVLTNSDLEKLVDTSDEWIVSRTGMRERRIAAEGEFTSTMGAEAGRRALADAGLTIDAVDAIIVATMTPDYISPSTAALIQPLLGAREIPVMDLSAACTGFIYSLTVAKALVDSGMYRTILVIGAEKMSAFMDYTDRNTCVLFGDGASAVVVSDRGPGLRIETANLGADGDLADLIIIPGGGAHHPASAETIESGKHYFKMNGKEVFKHAIRRAVSSCKQCLQQAGLHESELAWIVPHQANIRILDAIGKALELPAERVFTTIEKTGNTSAASVGIALDQLVKQQAISAGEHLLLVAFGGGLTWGAAILTKVNE